MVMRAGTVLTFLLSLTSFLMRDLSAMLAAPALRLAGALFVEGGPEASLLVHAGIPGADAAAAAVSEVGSFETGFTEDDLNQAFWALPNVIGFAPRAP